eukprot:scaffold84891_cov66-Phaeocystis_antarctica.AAC.2
MLKQRRRRRAVRRGLEAQVAQRSGRAHSPLRVGRAQRTAQHACGGRLACGDIQQQRGSPLGRGAGVGEDEREVAARAALALLVEEPEQLVQQRALSHELGAPLLALRQVGEQHAAVLDALGRAASGASDSSLDGARGQ